MAAPVPLPNGAVCCRHPDHGLCRAWLSHQADGSGALHLHWDSGAADPLVLHGLTGASMVPWGDDLLLALRSQQSDVAERVLRYSPASGEWAGIASLESYGALRWALPADHDTVLIGGEQLYRLGADEVETLGSADRHAVALPTGEVCTVRWDAESGQRRLVLLYAAGPPEVPDAPAAAWERVYEAAGEVFWLANEGLCSWSPDHGARLQHPDPGPFVHGVWRTPSGRLLWLVPETTTGPAALHTADGASLALPAGHSPLWPLDTAGRRWLMRREREHVPQDEAVSSGAGFADLLRARALGDELVEMGLFLPPPRAEAPKPAPVRGPAPLRDRSVTWLEVHPAVHAALAELGLETIGQLRGASRDDIVGAVMADGMEERRAHLVVRDLASILADLGLHLS